MCLTLWLNFLCVLVAQRKRKSCIKTESHNAVACTARKYRKSMTEKEFTINISSAINYILSKSMPANFHSDAETHPYWEEYGHFLFNNSKHVWYFIYCCRKRSLVRTEHLNAATRITGTNPGRDMWLKKNFCSSEFEISNLAINDKHIQQQRSALVVEHDQRAAM